MRSHTYTILSFTSSAWVSLDALLTVFFIGNTKYSYSFSFIEQAFRSFITFYKNLQNNISHNIQIEDTQQTFSPTIKVEPVKKKERHEIDMIKYKYEQNKEKIDNIIKLLNY